MDMKQDILKRDTGGNQAATQVTAVIPPVDVIEDENGITVKADLAGVAKDDLVIRVDGDTLTIEGSISLDAPQDMRLGYAEMRAAQYKRSFTLSRELDTAKIDAAIKDGVLNLHVPKLEQARPRRIEVRVD
jgi:HSP20 family molecular chaperone IbpA